MDEPIYTLTDYRGFPVSVPESKVKEFLAQQEKLKADPPPSPEPWDISEESMRMIEQRVREELAKLNNQE